MVYRAKYNYRNSGFDVLTWFRIHSLEFGLRCDGVVTRGKVALVDPGVYRTLLREGKIEEAIPEKLKDVGGVKGMNVQRLSFEKCRIIRDSYELYRGLANQAAARYEVSINTVIRIWRAAGLEIARRGNQSLTNKLL